MSRKGENYGLSVVYYKLQLVRQKVLQERASHEHVYLFIVDPLTIILYNLLERTGHNSPYHSLIHLHYRRQSPSLTVYKLTVSESHSHVEKVDLLVVVLDLGFTEALVTIHRFFDFGDRHAEGDSPVHYKEYFFGFVSLVVDDGVLVVLGEVDVFDDISQRLPLLELVLHDFLENVHAFHALFQDLFGEVSF